MIDNARVIYGIAKANAHYSNLINLDNFVKILKDSDKNIKPLLDWKLKKEWNINILFFILQIINIFIINYK